MKPQRRGNNHGTSFRCAGDFCDLLSKFDTSKKSIHHSREEIHQILQREQSKQRDRSITYDILKRLLTKEELHRIETDGYLVDLTNISSRLRYNNRNKVCNRSINLAKDEHRKSLWHLSLAEDSKVHYVLADSDCEDDDLNPNFHLEGEDKEEYVDCCGVCAQIYCLLDNVRKISSLSITDICSTEKNIMHYDRGLPYHEQGESREGKPNCLKHSTPLPSNVPNKIGHDLISQRQRQSRTHQICEKAGKSAIHSCSQVNSKEEYQETKKQKRNTKKSRALICGDDEILANKIQILLSSFGVLSHYAKTRNLCVNWLEDHTCKWLIMLRFSEIQENGDVIKWLNAHDGKRTVESAVIIILTKTEIVQDYKEFFEEPPQFFDLAHRDISELCKFLKITSSNKKRAHRRERNFSIREFDKEGRRSKTITKFRRNADFGHNDNEVSRGRLETSKIEPTVKNTIQKKRYHHFTSILKLDDGKTSFPYTILNPRRSDHIDEKKETPSEINYFSLVVCHDLFDTQEKTEQFLRPLIERYPDIQVLIWNYPGQAYTTYCDKKVLNNVFLSSCFEKLLLKAKEEKYFDFGRPCYLMGFGSGAIILMYFASHAHHTYHTYLQARAYLLLNGLTYVDPHYASVLHDCKNVFSCSPPSRPDLPLYFYVRFLFSKLYLKKTTSALAFNLYTAIFNPISLKGRIQICNGALNHVDVRPFLKNIFVPILSIHGRESDLVKCSHSLPLQQGRESASINNIHTLLNAKNPRVTLVQWSKCGHEIFQEEKYRLLLLLERLLTGFYEVNTDKPIFSTEIPNEKNHNIHNKTNKEERRNSDDYTFRDKVLMQKKNMVKNSIEKESLEGRFIDSVLKSINGNVYDIESSNNKIAGNTANNQNLKKSIQGSFRTETKEMSASFKPFDLTDYIEIKEYMTWRANRNKKRLIMLNRSSSCIQRAFRVHLARDLLKLMKRQKAALTIQRIARGHKGRKAFLAHKCIIWGVYFTQRTFRGFLGRQNFIKHKKRHKSQTTITRLWRGILGRKIVIAMKKKRYISAMVIQCFWRSRVARVTCVKRRQQDYSAKLLQRSYRGHLGKRKARLERDKYIFVKSKSSGIELGREMLVEHKLHATKLQSELHLLRQEKNRLEEIIDKLLDEIEEFERNIQEIESSMHRLNTQETTYREGSLNMMYHQEVKQKKMRYNEDFNLISAKISDRRDHLRVTEEKLENVEKLRHKKDNEVKELERKLVVLLEVQQRELGQLKLIQSLGCTSDTKDEIEYTYPVYTDVEKKYKEKSKLMESTEAMMKFGFMSMSMSYFSSMNMVKALKSSDTNQHTTAYNHYGSDVENASSNIQTPTKFEKCPFQKNDIQEWSVEEVVEWLCECLQLGQYADTFREGSVDGSFLHVLNNEDLKNFLGIEHGLHRKKILHHISQLNRCGSSLLPASPVDGSGATTVPELNDNDQNETKSLSNPQQNNKEDLLFLEVPDLKELFSWVRHKKIDKITNVLDQLEDKRFDTNDIRVQYVDNAGTVYSNRYNNQLFHLNQSDEHGNTIFHIAAQNGNVRLAKFLLRKGANPNHQNHQGQTPGHFALAYQFFEFGSWLFDPNQGNADDTLLNTYGLGPYDGFEA